MVEIAGLLETGSMILRLVLVWIGILFLPGFFAARILVNDESLDVFGIIAASFGLGLTLFSILALCAYLVSASLPLLFFLVTLEIVALALMYWRKRQTGGIKPLPPLKPTHLFLLATMIFLSVILFQDRAYDDYTSDTTVHMHFIRKMVARDQVSLSIFDHTRPLVQGASSETWNTSAAYSYNSWYAGIALTSLLSDIDPVYVWTYFPGIYAIVFISAYWFFARYLFGSSLVATGTLVVLAITQLGGLRGGVYPNHVIVIPVLIGLALALKFSATGQIEYLVAAVLVIFALPLIHPTGLTSFYMLMSAYALGCLCFKKKRTEFTRALKLLVLGVMVVLPILYLKWTFAQEDPSAILPAGADDIRIITLAPNLYLIDPLRVFFASLMNLVFLPLTIPAILVYLKKRMRWSIFVVSSLFCTFAIVFNPILFPIFSNLISFVAARRILGQVFGISGIVLAGYYFTQVVVYSIRKGTRFQSNWKQHLIRIPSPNSILAASLIFVLVGGIMLGSILYPASRRGLANATHIEIFGIRMIPAVQTASGKVQIDYSYIFTKLAQNEILSIATLNPSYNARLDEIFCGGIKPPCLSRALETKTFEFVGINVPAGSVLLTDYQTNFIITSLFDVQAVAPYHSATPYESHILQEIATVMDSQSTMEETENILTRYHVEYLLRRPILANEANKFALHPELFKQITSENGYVLYQVLPVSTVFAKQD